MVSHDFKVFYPHYLDIDEPISKIHREVAARIGPGFSVTAFVSTQDTTSLPGVEKLIPVAVDLDTFVKTAIYARAYLQSWDLVHTGPSRRHHLGILSQFRGSTLVHTLHATPRHETIVRRQKRHAQRADYVTAVSPYVKRWARETLGIQKNIRVIPNGIKLSDYEDLEETNRSGHILYVGRLIEQKHPEFVIQMAKSMPEFKFKICGSGPLESTLREDAPENVEIMGYVPAEKIRSLYSNALATVCPYEREGFGLVIIESLASGTPVIGYNKGNLPHLLTAESGILCETLHPEDWENAIKIVRDNFNQFSPYEKAEQYDWENVAQMYKRFYNDILQ